MVTGCGLGVIDCLKKICGNLRVFNLRQSAGKKNMREI